MMGYQLAGIAREGLRAAAMPEDDEHLDIAMELILEGLHQASLLAKDVTPAGATYGDMLKRMFAGFEE